MKKVLKLFTLMLAVTLVLTGCESKTAELEEPTKTILEFTDSSFNITADDLYNELKEEYGTSVLVDMVDNKILTSKYPTDDAETAYIEAQYQTYVSYYGSESSLLTTLQNYGYSSASDFKEKLIRMNYLRELATKDYVKANLTDKEIQKYYDSNIFGDITASHILIKVETTDSMTDDEKEEVRTAAKTTIDEILEKLENGEDFATLAKEYSEDEATASNGGSLGTFSYGEMEDAFETAARNLEVGKYTTTLVETSYGYHLIYKEAEKEKPALEEVLEYIKDELCEEKMDDDSKLQYKALIALREEYGIKFNDEDLEEYYETAKKNWLYSED